MKSDKVIVVPPCCFEGEDILCLTTLFRVYRAFELLHELEEEAQIFVTGNVPYVLGGETLAQLMKERFCSLGYKGVVRIVSGVGIFSEARAVSQFVSSNKKSELIIVSSSWYLWPGRRIWSKMARVHEILPPRFVSVKNFGGARTRFFYFCYWLCVFLLDWGNGEKPGWFERVLTRIQSKRLLGFRMRGCA